MTLSSVLQREPDWSHLPSAVSPSLSVFLNRCLEKDPKQRVPDIGAMRLAMAGAFDTAASEPFEPTAAPQLHVWQRPIPLALAALTLIALGGVAVWSLTRPAPPRVARFHIPLSAGHAFGSLGRRAVAVSPDGSLVVYQHDEAGLGSLWLRPLDQLQAVRVPGAEEGAVGPFFSADGQSIGFWAPPPINQLRKVAVTGGAAVTLADMDRPPAGASWGADDMILYAQRDGIWQVPGAGGTPELLIPGNEGEGIYGPQMLAGEEWVLFTVRSGDQSLDEVQIVAQSLTTNERTVLIDGELDGRYVPTGHLVYGVNNVLVAVPFDVDTREVTGGPVPLVEGVRETGGGETLLDAEFEEVVPALSPDGRWLAYVTRETGPLSIYVKPFPNVDDGLWNVSLDQQAVNPVWSPDGRALYYRVGARGNTLMVSQIETEPTFSHGTPELVFSLSGYRVGFGRDVGGPWDIAPDGRFLFPTSGTVEETDDEPFNGLIYVENWFEELKERVPVN